MSPPFPLLSLFSQYPSRSSFASMDGRISSVAGTRTDFYCCFRLSQMILDKVFHGILDQGAGCLIVFDEPEEDVSHPPSTRKQQPTNRIAQQKTYDATLQTIGHIGQIVDHLFVAAAKLR